MRLVSRSIAWDLHPLVFARCSAGKKSCHVAGCHGFSWWPQENSHKKILHIFPGGTKQTSFTARLWEWEDPTYIFLKTIDLRNDYRSVTLHKLFSNYFSSNYIVTLQKLFSDASLRCAIWLSGPNYIYRSCFRIYVKLIT